MRISLDHKRTSQALRDKMAYGYVSQSRLDQMIPRNFYPRLDTEEGKDFILRYLREFYDVSILTTFINRGMDINVPINSQGNRLAHELMSSSTIYDHVLTDFLRDVPGLDIAAKNNHGSTPLDYYFGRGGWCHGDVVRKCMQAEMAVLAFAPYREVKEHVLKRLHLGARYMPSDMLLEYIPAYVNLDDVIHGRSVLLTLISAGHMPVVEKLMAQSNFTPQSTDEKIIPAVIRATDATTAMPVLEKLVEAGFKFDEDSLDAAMERGSLDLAEYIMNAPASAGGQKRDAAARRKMFEWVIANKAVEYTLDAAQHKIFAKVADIDAPVFDGGTTLLMRAVLENNIDAVKKLLDAGACIDKKNSEGKTVADLARTVRYSETMSSLIKKRRLELNTLGDYEKLDTQQIAWKRGVLTYIFDFSAGQVVVRDAETKNLAVQSLADFRKSGENAVGNAAAALQKLGGDAAGYEKTQPVERSLSPIKKKMDV